MIAKERVIPSRRPGNWAHGLGHFSSTGTELPSEVVMTRSGDAPAMSSDLHSSMPVSWKVASEKNSAHGDKHQQ
jgi:hypothetical protein